MKDLGKGHMAFEMTEENFELVTFPMEIRLPKFLWLVLAARAKAKNCDLGEIFQAVFMAGIERDVSVVGVSKNPLADPPEQNAPAGSA